jgi:hypothetical protein
MNRSLQYLFLILLTIFVSLLSACGSGGGSGGATPAPTPPPPPPPASTTVRVKVLDVLGFTKAGAAVRVVGSTTSAVTTGSDGTALVPLTPDSDLLLHVQLAGHTEQFRPVRVASGQSAYLEVKLLARAPALTLPDAAVGGTLVGRNAARLTLPPNALVDAASGAAVTGAVQVEMTPVNTASHEIGAFPGTMRALSGGSEVFLATYGPVEYVFTQGGRPLALAAGQTAVIEMPLHASQALDGSPLVVGGTMPVWSLNEATGLWTQEGEGTIVASASSTGLALRATVNHFSWWNPDVSADRVTVNISFVFENGVTPTVCCSLEAFTTPGFPGPSGVATTTLPPTGGSVVINAPTVISFIARGQTATAALFGGVLDRTVPANAGTISVTISMGIDEDAPFPVITSPEAGVTTYTRDTLLVQASVSGDEPDSVDLRTGNQLIGAMAGTQATGYSFLWDTTSFPEASYPIFVRARRGESFFVSTSRTVVVDRTPPQIVQRAPAPGDTQASAGTGVSATFNEPLDPASLISAENPRVRLVANGVDLPVTLALSADSLTVTATPVAPLTSNTQYTVFVEGLTDRAGNVMVPAQWSFTVPLWALGSPDLRVPGPDGTFDTNVIGRPEIALASNGEPLVVWRQGTTDGRFTLRAARRIGALWVPLPVLPPVGQPNSFFGEQSMALDNTGQPVVAWTQTTSSIPGCGTTQPSELFVARFNGTAWVPLGNGNLNIEPCSLPDLPRVKVDPSGRPVLVSAQGPGLRTIQVRRFEGGDWTLLGTVPVQSVPSLPFPVTELRLALDGSTPYVLRSENRAGTISHFVARLDGSAFVPVGPQVATGNRDINGALVIDPQGRPVVAVKGPSEALLVLRFDGSAWAAVGSTVAANPFVREPSIVFDGSHPIVAWHDAGVSTAFVRRFDPFTDDWGATLTLRANVGTLSELRRLPTGGPIWGALTTGPFFRELRTVTATTLP